MSKHTKGPWVRRKSANDGGGIYAIDKERPSGFRSVASAHAQDDMEEHEANAALLAASPDLLAACEAAIEAIEENIDDEDTEDGAPTWAQALHMRIKAAIAKAKGNP